MVDDLPEINPTSAQQNQMNPSRISSKLQSLKPSQETVAKMKESFAGFGQKISKFTSETFTTRQEEEVRLIVYEESKDN